MHGPTGTGDPSRLSLASLALWLKRSVLEKASRFAHPGASGLEALACCEG